MNFENHLDLLIKVINDSYIKEADPDFKEILIKIKNNEELDNNLYLKLINALELSNISRLEQINIQACLWLKTNSKEQSKVDTEIEDLLELLNSKYEKAPEPYTPKSLTDYYNMLVNILDASENPQDLNQNFQIINNLSSTNQLIIYTSLLNYIINEINKLKIETIENANIIDYEERGIVVTMYQEYRLKLKFLQSKINELNNQIQISTNQEDNQNNYSYLTRPKQLIYSTTDYHNLANKSYFERDLKELPPEYLERTLLMLKNFKNGKNDTSDTKSLISKRNLYELKSDQIRIVFSHIKDDIFIIKGVFVKKEDWADRQYKAMNSRPKDYDLANLERLLQYAKKVEERVNNYIDENKRLGSRNRV